MTNATHLEARTGREDVQAQQNTRAKVAFITCNCSAYKAIRSLTTAEVLMPLEIKANRKKTVEDVSYTRAKPSQGARTGVPCQRCEDQWI
ncbi:hypothetical protein PsorP6_009976 [Peronosclerospora sorghi]|uniref:Uncharacterized protein n=1 Tax=Peronosclerospora sorghi TaxID=230839 RepID=A0ACC0VUE7_9STRA|nr:hypothetical protein PsorP6_009976 [Peronosclerospora sorghi]